MILEILQTLEREIIVTNSHQLTVSAPRGAVRLVVDARDEQSVSLIGRILAINVTIALVFPDSEMLGPVGERLGPMFGGSRLLANTK